MLKRNMAKNRIFLDANVVLDMLDNDRTGSELAIKLWEYVTINEYEIVISEDILTNIFYISKDKTKILKFFELILKRWDVVCFGRKVIERAVALSLENGLDLEDVLQCLCAKEHNCSFLITNDKRFYDCGIKIVNIENFLSKIN